MKIHVFSLVFFFLFLLSNIIDTVSDNQQGYKVSKIRGWFTCSINCSKHSVPTDFPVGNTIIDSIDAHPYKDGFTQDMILWNKAPVPTVFRVMTIVPHHPIVIFLKTVIGSYFTVDENLSSINGKLMTFIVSDDLFIQVYISEIKRYFSARCWYG